MSHDQQNHTEWTPRERELLAALPREDAVPSTEVDDLVGMLGATGRLRPRRRWMVPLQLAAAALLLAVGGVAGANIAARGSLEMALERGDLTQTERVLLLQRAGSAYVRAAQAYANATPSTDSTAVQVASQVLRGAATAVARQSLDDGLSARLVSALAADSRGARGTFPINWY